jgi:hypothetical protein
MNAETRIAPRGAALPAGLLLFILSLLAFVPSARAISGEEHLTTFGSYGSGAGQGTIMGKASASPVNGHIFVNDGNSRISEFTAWGEFVKAFGWDVAPAGVNEQQQVTVRATAGQFRLGFKGDTSADIPHGASAAEVQGALEALGSIGPAGVTVSPGPSDSSSTRYLVAFTGATLKEGDQEALGAEPGTVPLSGGTPASGVAVATVADGHPPTTGLESCTAESGCQEGSEGAGTGQIIRPISRPAVGANGDIYVKESFGGTYRVQKFDLAGRFLLMFGGEVDKTTHANVCTAASHDECGAGVPGTGPGQFSQGANGILIGPGGQIVVTDNKRVEEFEPDGTFLAEVSFGQPLIDLIAAPAGGGFFAGHFLETSNDIGIAKLSSTGASLCGFPVSTLQKNRVGANGTIAADPDGHLFAVREGAQEESGEVQIIQLVEFSGACPASILSELTLETTTSADPNALTRVQALGANSIGDLFITRVNAAHSRAQIEIYGPPPVQFEPPPQVPPSITTQYAVGVDPEDATVRAAINPHFWADTRYYVEYGLGKCSEGGCTLRQPLPPGVLVSKTAKGSPVTTGDVLLEGLAPGSVYHYRFVAQGGGGGPVRGGGGQVGSDGAEASFRTPALPDSAPQGCANEALRSGPAAALPDCRAYEMVSPVDKDGADIHDLRSIGEFSVALYQPATDGESIAYSSYRAFAGAPAGGSSLQYVAKRSSSGWETESISPPHDSKSPLSPAALIEREYQAFTPDLCTGWLRDPYSPVLAPEAVEGMVTLYRHNGCSASASPYEALTRTKYEAAPVSSEPEIQGFSASGSTSVFRVAIEGKVYASFEVSGGVESPVCVLPDETVVTTGCSVGSNSDFFYYSRGASLSHAVSEDGQRIYWTAASEGPGRIYLRLEGTSTVPVSQTQTNLRSIFLGAAADGSKALFMPEEGAKAKNLYLYSLASEESTKLAGEVIGVAGMSEDLSSVYFVAKEAIAGAGQNERGEEAQAGQPNLYLSREGTVTFIATLGRQDVLFAGIENNRGAYSDVDHNPLYHVAQATPDGDHLVFMSVNPITGYVNIDAAGDEADSEAFQYSAATGTIHCLSCQPSGARPHGSPVEAPGGGSADPLAALLPTALSALYAPHAQSTDGSKVFFTAYDALLPRDTDGVADVYEWERPGSGSCKESAPAYSPANGGCLYLVSSGTSASGSELIDISPQGRDVFFLTNQSLLSQDPGLIDIYDARQGGGLPPPPPPAAGCEGEACQGPYSPPNDPTPGSSTFAGAGNVKEAKPRPKKPHHTKKKHKKHSKSSSKKRQANRTADRGAAR